MEKMENITRKYSKIFKENTLFKKISNINDQSIIIEYDNASIYSDVLGPFEYDLQELKKFENLEDFDLNVHCCFISDKEFNNRYFTIWNNPPNDYTEKIIDKFINYNFDIETFRPFLIDIFNNIDYKTNNLMINFDNPETGNCVDYKIKFLDNDKPVKIIASCGFYGI
jgi:hypothetical protein